MGRPLKYRNVPTVVDGRRYASKREAKRSGELRILERGGIISDLKEQVSFNLTVGRVLVCKYIADFTYRDRAGTLVVEDAKGVQTDVFRIKAKLMKAVHGIDVVLS